MEFLLLRMNLVTITPEHMEKSSVLVPLKDSWIYQVYPKTHAYLGNEENMKIFNPMTESLTVLEDIGNSNTLKCRLCD